MTTERDILPIHERHAAASAIRELVDLHGSQVAAAAALSLSQNAINKAVLHARVGPGVMRLLLEHLELDMPGLLDRYGDRVTQPVRRSAATLATPVSPKEEAIHAALRYGNGVRGKDVRRLADRLESCLAGNATTLVWVELLLGEVRKRILWTKANNVAPRAKESDQRLRRTGRAKGRVVRSPGLRPRRDVRNSEH